MKSGIEYPVTGFSLDTVGMRYNGAEVLSGITLQFNAPQFVSIVGPNGAGKSTLLGVMAGLRPHYSGSCRYGGVEVSRRARREFAREVAFIPQNLNIEFPFTAEQVVLMGRTPHCDGLFESPGDWKAVEDAMAQLDTLPFRRRDFRSLSGGERQRVVLASALAQQPKTLLLDEPTAFLDLKHQVSIYALLRDLSRGGMLVISVTHDLNLAAGFADRIIALEGGRVAADDAPAQVLEREVVRRVFGVDSEVHRGPQGRPWITYGE